jgi:hypothetical protein
MRPSACIDAMRTVTIQATKQESPPRPELGGQKGTLKQLPTVRSQHTIALRANRANVLVQLAQVLWRFDPSGGDRRPVRSRLQSRAQAAGCRLPLSEISNVALPGACRFGVNSC